MWTIMGDTEEEVCVGSLGTLENRSGSGSAGIVRKDSTKAS